MYLAKLKVWETTTPADKSKMGALVAASLPNRSPSYKRDLQDKFHEQVVSDMLTKEEEFIDNCSEQYHGKHS